MPTFHIRQTRGREILCVSFEAASPEEALKVFRKAQKTGYRRMSRVDVRAAKGRVVLTNGGKA